MVNLCNLLLKYSHFSKVEDDIFLYIDRVLDNAYEIRQRQLKVKSELERLEAQLADKQKQASKKSSPSPKSPVKKRKVSSFDLSRSSYKENALIFEDSAIFPYKSDPETSMVGSSVLEQNILDSEEPLFGLSQSPPKREVLSARTESLSNSSPVRPPKDGPVVVKQTPSNILRTSRLSKSFASSESASKHGGKVATTTPISGGKWTVKKSNESPKVTPTTVKRFHSLIDGQNRLRQTKLTFPDHLNNSPMNDKEVVNDTFLRDFVVPTPPSMGNKSKFFRGVRSKKQSTMISGENTSKAVPESSAVKQPPEPDVDEDDIDQTFCPGVESFNSKARQLSVNIKQEPASQRDSRKRLQLKPGNKFDCLPKEPAKESVDTDMSEVLVLQGRSQESIISVPDSESENDQFMAALKEERADDMGTMITPASTVNSKSPKSDAKEPPRTCKPTNVIAPSKPPGLCYDCIKLYQFHTSRGFSDDTARSKLPRNCRNCRIALLHDTPHDFWNPDFIATPE